MEASQPLRQIRVVTVVVVLDEEAAVAGDNVSKLIGQISIAGLLCMYVCSC